jgi:hypothetical protein
MVTPLRPFTTFDQVTTLVNNIDNRCKRKSNKWIIDANINTTTAIEYKQMPRNLTPFPVVAVSATHRCRIGQVSTPSTAV